MISPRRIAAIARKEVLHVVRDPRSLYLALGMPAVLLILFGYGVSFDMDHLPVVVVDEDIDVTNLEQLMWAMCTRSDPKQSIQFIEGSWDSPADPRLSPEKRAKGDMTHSVAIIDACRPWTWRDKFPPANTPSAEIARKAREKFGWLLDGKAKP